MTDNSNNMYVEKVIDITKAIDKIKKNYKLFFFFTIIFFGLYFVYILNTYEKKLKVNSENEFKTASTFTITELGYLQNTIPRYFELLPDNYIPEENFDPDYLFEDVVSLINQRFARKIISKYIHYDQMLANQVSINKNYDRSIKITFNYTLLDNNINIEQLKKDNFSIVNEIVNEANIIIKENFFQNYIDRFLVAKQLEVITLTKKLETEKKNRLLAFKHRKIDRILTLKNNKNDSLLSVEKNIDLLKNSLDIATSLEMTDPFTIDNPSLGVLLERNTYLHGTIALEKMIQLEESKKNKVDQKHKVDLERFLYKHETNINRFNSKHEKNLKNLHETIKKNNAENILQSISKDLMFYSIGSSKIQITSSQKYQLKHIMFTFLLSIFISFLYILIFRKNKIGV